ncbi:MAG: hypothetical protein P8Y98_15135 [Anaerolineales bacterium]
MSGRQDQTDSHRSPGGANDAGRTPRLVATLVLVPSVPMLIVSIAALALFYLAPTRFGNLIDRLPGETFIRTALVFAPATLFPQRRGAARARTVVFGGSLGAFLRVAGAVRSLDRTPAGRSLLAAARRRGANRVVRTYFGCPAVRLRSR